MYSNLVDTIGFLKGIDPDVADAMDKELARQKRNLELIASENIVSPAVMAAMGSVLTNKYAEGYPGKRYYGGCEDVDIVENIAIERACKLSEQSMRMYRLTPAHRLTLRFTWLFFARRYRNGHEPCTRRSPLPWLTGQHFRYYLYSLRIQSEPGNRTCGL